MICDRRGPFGRHWKGHKGHQMVFDRSEVHYGQHSEPFRLPLRPLFMTRSISLKKDSFAFHSSRLFLPFAHFGGSNLAKYINSIICISRQRLCTSEANLLNIGRPFGVSKLDHFRRRMAHKVDPSASGWSNWLNILTTQTTTTTTTTSVGVRVSPWPSCPFPGRRACSWNCNWNEHVHHHRRHHHHNIMLIRQIFSSGLGASGRSPGANSVQTGPKFGQRSGGGGPSVPSGAT